MFFITKKLISLVFFGFVLFCVLYTVGFFGGESPFKKNVTDTFRSFSGQSPIETTSVSKTTGSWRERREQTKGIKEITNIEKDEEEKDLFSNFYLDSNPNSKSDQFSLKNFYK